MPEAVATLPAVDALFAEWNRPDSPGAALAIIHEGQIVYQQGYGSANLEYGIPITPATIFHVASLSKQFTAATMALLAREGKLSLDDEIHTHLPELADLGHPITIRHLIHHTSGLRDQWELLTMAGWRMDDVITHHQIMEIVKRQRELNFPPGTEWLYCNTGYTLMAEIVRRVTGQSLRQFADARIFQPLGMTSTLFFDDHEEIVPNRAYSYRPNQQTTGFRKSVLSYANVGATSLFTTVGDLAKWLINFERPVVGDEQLIRQLQEPYFLTSGEDSHYAFGMWHKSQNGIPYVGHGGADAGFRTVVLRFPTLRLGVVILANLSTFAPQSIALKVAEVYLGDSVQWGPTPPPPASPAPAEPIAISSDELHTFAGSYYSDELDITYTVTVASGELQVSRRRLEDIRQAGRVALGQSGGPGTECRTLDTKTPAVICTAGVFAMLMRALLLEPHHLLPQLLRNGQQGLGVGRHFLGRGAQLLHPRRPGLGGIRIAL
ncbi:MAG: beta-lactamase family protein [Symbiobacteriaceae bacterium]|nr:beta-lactamase family protein [Symbiobacteriaceae bacterium]